jgi:hypothetical protein
MNDAVKNFLGDKIVNSLPEAKQFNPTIVGIKLPNNTTDCVSQTRSLVVTPDVAAAILMSNEWYVKTKGKAANRVISETRVNGELRILFNLMVEGQFAPHRSTLGITSNGRAIEGQGRLLAQLKAGLTYTYTVDVVLDDQRSVAKYLGASRGSTASTSLSQIWEITFGLTKKQASIAQQVFNGVLWHEEGILGGTERTSTKAAVCEKETLDSDLRTVSEIYAGLKIPKGINPSALATIELLALRKGYAAKKVEAFRERVISGIHDTAKEPCWYLREKLTRRDSGRPVRYQTQVGWIKGAFDKFMIGDAMTRVDSQIVSF